MSQTEKSPQNRQVSEETGLDNFDITCIKLMGLVYGTGAGSDTIDEAVEYLNDLKVDHVNLGDKVNYLQEQVNIDHKTGLLKYRENYLENTIKSASRALELSSKENFYKISYMRIDVDDFSHFNTKYGHDAGDQVLSQVAQILMETARPTDLCIRYGGEEFDILLPATPVDGAKVFADKIYEKIRHKKVYYGDAVLSVTVSGGITGGTFTTKEMASALFNSGKKYIAFQKEVDDALYAAKVEGKNCYRVYDSAKSDYYKECRRVYNEKTL